MIFLPIPFKSLTASYAARDLLDISPAQTEAAGAIVDDSFTRCFKSNPPEPWKWNICLFPLWCLGVVIRYGFLFPLSVAMLTVGWIIFLSCYFSVHFLLKGNDKLWKKLRAFAGIMQKHHGWVGPLQSTSLEILGWIYLVQKSGGNMSMVLLVTLFLYFLKELV